MLLIMQPLRFSRISTPSFERVLDSETLVRVLEAQRLTLLADEESTASDCVLCGPSSDTHPKMTATSLLFTPLVAWFLITAVHAESHKVTFNNK